MTGVARGKHAAVVEPGTAPGPCRMAIIANIVGDDVFRMLAGSAAVVMTERTFHRRALELPAYVATGAVDKLVFTGEWETGSKMIEAFQAFSNGVGTAYRKDQQRQDRRR